MRFLRHTNFVPVVVGILVGASLCGAVLALDDRELLPIEIAPANARSLLGATFGAVVTAGAFAFWMRPIAAQLAASTVPTRLVVQHLDDEFQRRTIAVTVGALAYEAIAVFAVPTSESASAPPIATLVGAIVGVGAIGGLLIAMHHAERSTRSSVLVGEAARTVIQQIQDSARAVGDPAPRSAPTSRAAATVVAPATGWIRDLDVDDLLEHVPPDSTVRVEVDVGSFVIADWTVLASVWAPASAEDQLVSSLSRSFRIGDERAQSTDMIGSLSQFVDIGVHAAGGGSAKPSTVYETMWHLGAILHELCRHELAIADRQTDGGGVLLRRRMESADLVELAVDRIRQVTASEPQTALELVRVLRDVRQDAVARERRHIVEVLDDQCDRVVAQCEHAGALPSDVERVAAARRGGRSSDAGIRAEEYPSTETSDEETSGDAARAGSVGARR